MVDLKTWEIIILILCSSNTQCQASLCDHLTKDKSEVSFLEVEWVIT